jgi:dienelactone hydrolase
MAEMVLFHSVLGLRPGVIAAAERLRAAGHTVHTPDLYDGEVFDDIDDGSRKEDALGYQEIARRAREAVAGLPAGLVFAGFSLGAVHAEVLAASRAGALGAVLMHGAVPVEGLSGDLPEYDPASSEEMWERVLAFLDRIDARGSEVEGAR